MRFYITGIGYVLAGVVILCSLWRKWNKARSNGFSPALAWFTAMCVVALGAMFATTPYTEGLLPPALKLGAAITENTLFVLEILGTVCVLILVLILADRAITVGDFGKTSVLPKGLLRFLWRISLMGAGVFLCSALENPIMFVLICFAYPLFDLEDS